MAGNLWHNVCSQPLGSFHDTLNPPVHLLSCVRLIKEPADLHGCPQSLVQKAKRATMGQSAHFCVQHAQKVEAELQVHHLNSLVYMLQTLLHHIKVVLIREIFSALLFLS